MLETAVWLALDLAMPGTETMMVHLEPRTPGTTNLLEALKARAAGMEVTELPGAMLIRRPIPSPSVSLGRTSA
jgi:hypothetical protein